MTAFVLAGAIAAMNPEADIASRPTAVSDQELFAALDLKRPGLAKVRAAVNARDYAAAAAAWAEYFRARLKPTPHFNRATWPAFVKQEFPQLVEPIVQEADKLAKGHIAHAFVRLPVRGRRIDWLHNPKKDTNYIGLVGSQWFMNPLGRAYLLTGDEKYAETFAWIFESWYDQLDAIVKFRGGFTFGTVFRAYYPGIRSRILVDNYYCMAQSPALSPAVHVKIMKHLLANAAWLYRQERRYRRGNQQVAAVLGLGIIGIVFPEFRSAEAWAGRAEKRMKEHLQRDFFPDGGHKELCTQYHKTCLRDMSYVALTAERNGRPSLFRDKEAVPLLEKSHEWLARLVMPTGETPALHSAVFSTDWAVHLTIAARYFRRPDFLWLARRFWQQGIAPTQKAPFAFACYLVNEELGRRAFAGIKPKRPEHNSVHLDTSGFAVMRTGWTEADRYLVFQYGRANTGHAYPGALAFCLEMNRELIATNPGSPRSYRHPAYGYCHSTRSHNVVTIDGRSHPSQRGIAPGGKLHTLADLPGAWYVSASHGGYRSEFQATHSRSILVVKKGPILIRDQVTGAAGHRAEWNFHTPLTPTVGAKKPGKAPDRRIALRGGYRLCPAFPGEIVRITQEKRWEAVLPRDCQPDDCGTAVNVLRLEKAISGHGVQFCIALMEHDGQIEAITRQAFRLRAARRTFLVLFRDREPHVSVLDVETDAECVCVCFEGTQARRVWLVAGKSLTIAGRSWLDADEPQSLELTRPQ